MTKKITVLVLMVVCMLFAIGTCNMLNNKHANDIVANNACGVSEEKNVTREKQEGAQLEKLPYVVGKHDCIQLICPTDVTESVKPNNTAQLDYTFHVIGDLYPDVIIEFANPNNTTQLNYTIHGLQKDMKVEVEAFNRIDGKCVKVDNLKNVNYLPDGSYGSIDISNVNSFVTISIYDIDGICINTKCYYIQDSRKDSVSIEFSEPSSTNQLNYVIKGLKGDMEVRIRGYEEESCGQFTTKIGIPIDYEFYTEDGSYGSIDIPNVNGFIQVYVTNSNGTIVQSSQYSI